MGHVHKSPSAPHKLEALKAGLAGVGGPRGLALCLCQSGLRVSLSRHFCEPALCQASCQVPGIGLAGSGQVRGTQALDLENATPLPTFHLLAACPGADDPSWLQCPVTA